MSWVVQFPTASMAKKIKRPFKALTKKFRLKTFIVAIASELIHPYGYSLPSFSRSRKRESTP